MRVTLFGQKWLGLEVLRALQAIPCVTVAAVCPDVYTDRLAEAARCEGLNVVDLDGVPRCDLGVAAHCQRFLAADVRQRCGLGVLAYHPSLLPRHRGRDAVHWTLAMRDPVAGGSVYWMDDGSDTGPLEAQDWCYVLPGESATELWRRALAPMGVRLLVESVARLARGETPLAIPQDERVATWEPGLHRAKLGAINT